MPTRRAVIMLCFSLLLLLGAWISKLLWLYFAFASIIVMIITGFILSKFLLINIDIRRSLTQKAYEGELVNIEIELRNRIPLLDQSLQLQDIFTPAVDSKQIKTMFFNGLGKGKMKFSYQEKCYKRGAYTIGPFKLKIFEPLGLFYSQKDIAQYSRLVVYPTIFIVHTLPFILGHLAPRFGEQTTRISGEYEEFYGIREYQQEDGWRRIHWRSTARTSELMVRHFEQSAQWNAMLVLDAAAVNEVGSGKDTTFEYAIKTLASLMKYLLLKNASFGFLASSNEPVYIGVNKGKDHFYRILESLATIKADGQMQIHQLLGYYKKVIPPSSSLIIATTVFNEQRLIKLLKQLKLQKNTGIIPVILDSKSFLAGRKQSDFAKRAKGIKKAFDQVSSQVYVINCEDDLKINFFR